MYVEKYLFKCRKLLYMTKSNFFDITCYNIQKSSQFKHHLGDNENHKFPNITKYDRELKRTKASKNRRIQYD